MTEVPIKTETSLLICSPLICIDLIYLRCKTIISQNVSSEAQVKNFFVSWKGYAPFSRCSSFCTFNHPMIYQI